MLPIQSELLKVVCTNMSVQEAMYNQQSDSTKQHDEAERNINEAAKALIGANWPVYTHTVSGVSCVDHYDLDTLAEGEFGDLVMPDSEQGQFFCYCTESIANQVLEYVRKAGKHGSGLVTYYSGDTELAKFNMYCHIEDDSGYMVKGAGNWHEAKETLKLIESIKINQ